MVFLLAVTLVYCDTYSTHPDLLHCPVFMNTFIFVSFLVNSDPSFDHVINYLPKMYILQIFPLVILSQCICNHYYTHLWLCNSIHTTQTLLYNICPETIWFWKTINNAGNWGTRPTWQKLSLEDSFVWMSCLRGIDD